MSDDASTPALPVPKIAYIAEDGLAGDLGDALHGDLERRFSADGPRPVCAGCACFAADVAGVWTDQGARSLCWYCRHAVVRHGIKLAVACKTERTPESGDGARTVRVWPNGETCSCSRRDFYPPDVLAALDSIDDGTHPGLACGLQLRRVG